MKKNICFYCVLLLMLSAAPPLFSQETTSATLPAAEMIAPDFHFDAVPEGTQVKHVYLLKNKGKLPLKVVKVKTG